MTTIRRKHNRYSKLAKKKRKQLFSKIGSILFILLFILVGAIFILRVKQINISDIRIKGNSTISKQTLKEFVQEKIFGNYIFVFPKSNIFLYPKKDLQISLLENFKEIKETEVSFENFQSISIKIEERKPYALYCGDYVSTTTSCYFLDEDGLIFTKAPDFSGNVFLRYFGVLDKEDLIGGQFMPSKDFKEINFFLTSLSKINIVPIAFSVLDENDFEVHLENGGKILFGRAQNLSDVYENIQSVFDSEDFNKDNLPNLDYADFRFGNKVYFKFK